MKCKYQTGEMSGLDCPCNKCQKIRNLLKKKEKKGEIYLSGLPSDLRKIRR